MITKIKAALFDCCVGTMCATLVVYAACGAAYQIGKIKGKAKLADEIDELIQKGGTIIINISDDEAE